MARDVELKRYTDSLRPSTVLAFFLALILSAINAKLEPTYHFSAQLYRCRQPPFGR
jgi:hypothetical protein